MSAALRRWCNRLDEFETRRPILAFTIALAICFACELAYSYFQPDDGVLPVIHTQGVSA